MNSIGKLFSDNNSINEKSIVGFLSFGMMVFTLFLDMVTGLLGREFPIHEFVYDSFLYLSLGALGIASVDTIFRKSSNNAPNTDIPDYEEWPDAPMNDNCNCEGKHPKCHNKNCRNYRN